MKPTRTLRPWLIRGFQLAVAAGLLAVVWRFADGATALELLSQAHFGWILAAAVVLNAQIFLSARRWQITARQLGVEVSFSTALSEYYLSQLVNQALPGGVVGDASRAVRARHQRGLLASGQSVIFERLSGQVALFGLMTIAIAVTIIRPGGLDWPDVALPLFLAGIGALIAVPVVLWVLVRTLPPRSADALRGFGQSAGRALLSRAVLGEQVALSVATSLANIAGFIFCAWAIGADVGVGVSLAVVPLILLTMLIPVTISGWGLREAAAAALLPLAGFVASEGLATSVAFGLVLLATSLPGIFFATRSPGTGWRGAASRR